MSKYQVLRFMYDHFIETCSINLESDLIGHTIYVAGGGGTQNF